jgi:hypothetical protein
LSRGNGNFGQTKTQEKRGCLLTGKETYGILMATKLKKGLRMATRQGPVTREDLKTIKEEIVHQFHIISEDLRSDVKQVAEGVVTVNAKLDRGHQELRREIQETRQEVLAAIKFSFAELDRRLTTLEKEFLELRNRVDRMESRSSS